MSHQFLCVCHKATAAENLPGFETQILRWITDLIAISHQSINQSVNQSINPSIFAYLM